MSIMDVVKLVTDSDCYIDVSLSTETLTINYLSKNVCECNYNENNNCLTLNTDDDSMVITINDIDEYVITDASDLEYTQVSMEKGNTKMHLTFV